MNSNDQLPFFLHDKQRGEVLRKIANAIPSGVKLFLVGGAARNAMYYSTFHKGLPTRDYDLVLVGSKKRFVTAMRKIGFTNGFLQRKHEFTLRCPIKENPVDIFEDYVILDVHQSKKNSISQNLKEEVSFTINGFALPFNKITSKNWKKTVIALPGALTDLKNKKMRTNAIGLHPGNLFACMRFMSLGFKPPSKKEIRELVQSHATFEKWRFPRNVKKISNYVGGKANVKKLAKKLGIKDDVLSYKTVLKWRNEFSKENKS